MPYGSCWGLCMCAAPSAVLRNPVVLCLNCVSAAVSVQEQLAAGGVLWFPDLTAVDSTWILPISVGVVNLLIVEVSDVGVC